MAIVAVFLLFYLGACMAAEFQIKMPNARPLQPDEYLCTAQKMDGATKYITSFKPAEKKHAHHMLVFSCEDGPASHEPYWSCSHGKPICRNGDGGKILMSWAMDAPGYDLPADTAFAVGRDTKNRYLVLQVHYKHVEDFIQNPSLTDESAMAVGMTYQTPKRLANLMIIANNEGIIPAESRVTLAAGCVKTSPVPLHPISFRVHAHFLSDSIHGTVIRDGERMVIGENSPKKPQTFYKVSDTCPKEIRPGDKIMAYCNMDNNSDKDVYIGDTASDEMCNLYLMYSVAAEHIDHLDFNDQICDSYNSEFERNE